MRCVSRLFVVLENRKNQLILGRNTDIEVSKIYSKYRKIFVYPNFIIFSVPLAISGAIGVTKQGIILTAHRIHDHCKYLKNISKKVPRTPY